ncbi:GTPase IMAP family member 8-like [Triplophysa dalaica]|uniref:GTPase IMAP family member 8-like n=1 Tax=Triplophysa dalaica TaxID=1582913 RepID=UPI0024DFBC99|nr:GTPase IMAP family member 8-like [Triplophysa dalaica]
MNESNLHHLSELRIVLMGYKGAGSSAGNIILDRKRFGLTATAQCVKSDREVADRLHITVIDAPGWWSTVPVDQCSELLKQEILLSVSLCPPGPHPVLMAIRVDTRFREKNRKVFQGYVELLSERVWSHTIVLFTCGNLLRDRTIEQHIESEGEHLQWLVEKCGNRYHVLNSMNRSDDTQIKALLEKIEETVTQNNGCHFDTVKFIQEIEERRRAEKERAEEQMKRMQKSREANRSKKGDTEKLSELRIVLMGSRGAGKSSSGNIILNREEFDLKRTAQCVKRQREVADRHITVIEAPGWWKNKPVEESPELLKQEILLSVSLCPPGPHVVLLVICADIRFKDAERKVFQGYVDLLSEGVWSHTIVLFTHGDFLGDTSIEQHIEREGEDLQWLVEKCGNRYHVLNNKNRSDDTQIKDLLEKIEETVMKNNGCHFEIDRKILRELEEKRRAEEERAEERVKRMKKQREMIRSQMSEKLSELRIVLMGSRRAGKSSAGNIILNREEFDLKRTVQCVKRQREVADRHITVIEAPGWWKNVPVDQSSELLKQEILLSVTLCPPGPHVVLLVVHVDTGLKEDERKVFQGYVDLLGERVWSHTIVLFTHGDFLGDTSIEQHIESEGEDLQWLVEKCGNRYHVLNNKNRSDDTQIKDLLEKIQETVTQNNVCHFNTEKFLHDLKQTRNAETQTRKEQMRMMQKSKDFERLRMMTSDTEKLSDLRIVLLGGKGAGKSSAGNIILNREEFDLKTTAQCVKRQREVADRHITVIEAPGWWINVPVEKSSELLKQEILLSVTLCPPGPHVVLLAIRVGTGFKEDERKVFQGYMDLLSERVWSHTIVLFTHGDFLGDTSIEQHIESEGEDLQWLVEKCGNRYHVLNNKNRSDDTQIKDLLEKIEETVTQNNGCHFNTEKFLQDLKQRSKAEKQTRKEQMRMMQKSETVKQINGCNFVIDRKILHSIGERRAVEERAKEQRKKIKDTNLDYRGHHSHYMEQARQEVRRSTQSTCAPMNRGHHSHYMEQARHEDRRSTQITGNEKISTSSLMKQSDWFYKSRFKADSGSVSSLSSGYGSSCSLSQTVEYLKNKYGDPNYL